MKHKFLNVLNPTGKCFYVCVNFNFRTDDDGYEVCDTVTIEGETMPSLREIHACIADKQPSDIDLAAICREYNGKNDSYESTVASFVHCRYSSDDELALSANLRMDPEAYAHEDAEFQKWRKRAKAAASELFKNTEEA